MKYNPVYFPVLLDRAGMKRSDLKNENFDEFVVVVVYTDSSIVDDANADVTESNVDVTVNDYEKTSMGMCLKCFGVRCL